MLSVNVSDTAAGKRLVSLTQSKRDIAIRLGIELLDHSESCAQSWGAAEWQSRISKLQTELGDQEQEVARKVKRAVEEARAAEKTSSLAETERLRSECTHLRSVLQKAHEEANQRCDQKVSETRDFYEGKLNACQARLEELCGLTQNSTKKGQRGEEHVLSELNMLFPRAEIEDTHATPGRGDFIVRDGNLVMMIETKNYTRNVQKTEVDKFYRDLESPANTDFQCAVLVSLRSGVCCKEDFSFEMRGERPVMFIHHLEKNFDSLMLAAQFFRLVLSAGESVDLQSKATQDCFKSAAVTLKRGYAKQRTRLNRFHTEQLALVAEQETRLAELYTALGQKL